MWSVLADNLPHATATLNATATVFLALGLLRIRQGNPRAHRKMMLIAFGLSGAFLALYLLHKVALYQTTGAANKRFPSDPSIASDAARYVYFGILGTHLVLAIFVPFLAIRAIYLAMTGRIVAHKRWVKFAYPAWMYVSVTGVLVYLMLYQIYAV
ncbi:MAG: DUF420 domain-containing protein [Novipirellula sp. JB048]